jgi:hypothetical protein
MHRKLNGKCRSDLLMIQGQHPSLRCHPQKRSTPMVPPSTGSNRQESGPPTGCHPRGHWKGEGNYLHTVRSNKAKPKQLILNKTYLIKVAINSDFWTCKATKGLSDSAKAATKGRSLLSIYYFHYFSHIHYT